MPTTVNVVVDGSTCPAQEVPSGCTVGAWKELVGQKVQQTGRIVCRAERGGQPLPNAAALPRPPAQLHVDGPPSVLKALLPVLRRPAEPPPPPHSARAAAHSSPRRAPSAGARARGFSARHQASRQAAAKGSEEPASVLDGETAATVLSLWFRELTPDDWFRQSYEHCDRVKMEFGGLHARAAAGELAGWMERPDTCLALVVILDQFSRFLYRGQPEEKAWDPQARLAATVALQRGDDRQFSPGPQRIALYLPFMHSEDGADKRRFINLMRTGLGAKPRGAWEASAGSPARQRGMGSRVFTDSWQRDNSAQRTGDSSDSEEDEADQQERRAAQRGRAEQPQAMQRMGQNSGNRTSQLPVEYERGVAVCVLHVTNSEGQILVHVAKWEGGKAYPHCQFPGTKQKNSEFPYEAVKRLLLELKQIVPNCIIKKTEREVTWKASPTYGTRTRYVRTKYIAVLGQQEVRPAPVPVPLSTRSMENQRPDAVMALHQVYMVTDGPSANNAYAWMLPEEFEHLSGPGGSKALERWIGAIDLRAHAVSVPPPKKEEGEEDDWRDRADLAQGMSGNGQTVGYSIEAATEGVPSLPVLTMNHEHSKRFRTMRLDSQTQQAYQRDRKEINRTMRYQCLVCAVCHDFRLSESLGGGAEHQHQHL